MSALPRPDLAPGPAKALNDALHDLHHRAGWPSLRTLGAEARVSHTTVSKVFSRPELPTWGTLELLVEAMHGDTTQFHDLWLAASTPTDGARTPAPRIAGRHDELAAVRRHLDAGTGLLLVTGEAGIGKTTVISAAAEGCDRHVLSASGRPLSTEAPFLPVTGLLRAAWDVDRGAWLAAGLRRCPYFVPQALVPVLPEIADEHVLRHVGTTRSQLLEAVRLLVQALDAERRLAVRIEDLHWCDPETLDVVEVLVADVAPVPVVASWRTEDPGVDGVHGAWFARVVRSGSTVALGPLTQDDTFIQLGLQLGREPEAGVVEEIFRRGAGVPLFTEQLAASESTSGERSSLLEGILAARLVGLDDEAWRVARVLGVADRPLTTAQLRHLLDPVDPIPGLRVLARRHLLTKGGEEGPVELRHPLIAEAVRERLAPGEAQGDHVRLAELLMGQPHPPAADIARHWRVAGDVDAELEWQVRACFDADRLWAMSEGHRRSLRVLELWPQTTRPPPRWVSLAQIHTGVIQTAILLGRPEVEVRSLLAAALAAGLPDDEVAPILSQAADVELTYGGDPDLAAQLLDNALARMEEHPPPYHPAPGAGDPHPLALEQVYAALARIRLRVDQGRFEPAMQDARRALQVATDCGHDGHRQSMTAMIALIDGLQGRLDDAREGLAVAKAVHPVQDKEPACLRVAAAESTVLLLTGEVPEEILAATAEAREQARKGFTFLASDQVTCNVATALHRAGNVARAERAVADYLQHHPHLAPDEAHLSRSCHIRVLTRQGRFDEAAAVPHPFSNWLGPATLSAEDVARAELDLWSGDPESAAERLRVALERLIPTDWAALASEPLLLAARAGADCVERGADPHRVVAEVRELRARAVTDPLGPNAVGVTIAASAATWQGELARAAGRSDSTAWGAAVAAWDKVGRPHDAAYCRWRAAQTAMSEGHGTTAARLLTRAAKDAREHVPLSVAIARVRSPI